MADVTEFIRVRWPAMERDLAFQQDSFALIFSTMKLKALLSLPSEMIGTPRYFPNTVVLLMPSSFSTRATFSA